jgi:hypothetical protein
MTCGVSGSRMQPKQVGFVRLARRGLLWGGGIEARSVSDGIGASLGVAPYVASDPPAYAEGFYGAGSYKPGA